MKIAACMRDDEAGGVTEEFIRTKLLTLSHLSDLDWCGVVKLNYPFPPGGNFLLFLYVTASAVFIFVSCAVLL